jgi:hypothetical protein
VTTAFVPERIKVFAGFRVISKDVPFEAVTVPDPKAKKFFTLIVPELRYVLPVYVFALLSTNVPAPVTVSDPLPEMIPLRVSVSGFVS